MPAFQATYSLENVVSHLQIKVILEQTTMKVESARHVALDFSVCPYPSHMVTGSKGPILTTDVS